MPLVLEALFVKRGQESTQVNSKSTKTKASQERFLGTNSRTPNSIILFSQNELTRLMHARTRVRASRESARLRVGGYRTRQKRRKKIVMTNIKTKGEHRKRPSPEREVEKRRLNEPGWRFFGLKYLSERKYISHHHFHY